MYDAVCEYSPTYAEQPAVSVFERAIMAGDLRLESQVVPTPGSDPDEPRRNLIIHLGPQPSAMLWIGHTDTVVLPDDEVHEPRFEGDILHGLGAVDMKSACAAAVEAALAIKESGVKLERGITIGLVVGEEEYGDGIERLYELVQAPLAIVGEPSALVPCFQHYGYMETELTTRGKRAHAAVPEHGANAIHAMLAWLTAVLEVQGEHEADLVLNPRGIRGSSPLFAVPESCQALLDAHLRAGSSPADVREILEHAQALAASKHPDVEFAWEELFYAPGYRQETTDEHLRFIWDAYDALGLGPEVASFRSHSDASFMHTQGTKTIVIGPGDLRVAHTPHEHIRFSECVQAAHLYAELFLRVGLGETR